MESTFPWSRALGCIGLLVLSNIFMNLAWYGHLAWFKHKGATLGVLALVVLVAWLIALPEYILQVPANRLGHHNYGGPFAAPQLKVIQEAVTLVVFTVITILVLKEKPRWTDYAAFVLVFAGVAVSSWGAWVRMSQKAQGASTLEVGASNTPRDQDVREKLE